MTPSRKITFFILMFGIGLFGYTQFLSASNIGVVVTENEFLEKNERGTIYNVELEFNNPSLLILNAGETDFSITVEDTKIADGILEPFVLPSMSKVNVKGTYLEEEESKFEENQSTTVKISGVTKYDVFFTSIEVPFMYFPSEDQARQFIHHK